MSHTSIDPTHPDRRVIEVSIFGPGKGECVVVHLGGDDWFIIDSCIDQVDRQQPALSYLRRLKVDIASRVRLVVTSHAHDDHMAGLADVFAACSSATFVCSSAITSEEFFALVEADADIERQLRRSVRVEYRRLLEEVERRGRDQLGLKPLRRASEQRVLWERAATDALPAARVVALSPSDEAISRSLQLLAQGTGQSGRRRRLSAADPNELAVALWAQVGSEAILLGADLLRGPAGCGWIGVLATFAPPVGATLVKVPHHGAPNAHHEQVWSDLLAPSPLALLAPYRAGAKPRPTSEDVRRLCDLTDEAYATADSRLPAPDARVKRTAAALGGLARNVRAPWGKSGHVRARLDLSEKTWRVETVWPAQRLC